MIKITLTLKARVTVTPHSDTDHLAFYSHALGFDPSDIRGDEVQARCPFHNDDRPSLSVNIKTGLWKCYAGRCGLGGNRATFEKYLKEGAGTPQVEITPEVVRSQHEIFIRSDAPLKYVKEKRGISEHAISKYQIGFDGERILIPIFKDGKPVNFRRFKRPGGTGDKVLNMKGMGAAAIFPEQVLKDNTEILLCEGEWDAMVANEHGFHAVTLTGGAGTFPVDLASYFLGKDIVIAYDCDPAGRKGAKTAGTILARVAKRVRVLDLELGDKGEDISDWFLKFNRNADGLKEKISKAPNFKSRTKATPKKDIPIEVLSVHLSDVGSGKYVYHRVEMTIHIAGKDTAPYVLPGEISWDCEMGEKLCHICNLSSHNGQMVTKIDETMPDELLEMLNTPRMIVDKIIRRAAGIPEKCPRPTSIIQKWYNLEIVRAIPDLDFAYEGRTYTIRTMFYRGHGIQPNHTYDVIGVAVPDPNTQIATVVVYKLKESEDTLSQFQVTPEFLEQQKIFQVA